MPMSIDEALRVAMKVAIDAGDIARARGLLDLREDSRRTTPVALLPATN
jgi:hypothetical protein